MKIGNNLQQNGLQPQQNLNLSNKKNTSFKGPLDSIITQTLTTIDTNPMINAAMIDVFAMVLPRTYIDTKERNSYAGAETFIREIMGTFCVCLSSGIIAKGISRIYNNVVDKKNKINPDIWATRDSLALLKHSWDKSDGNIHKYVSNVIKNTSGIAGRNNVSWKNIAWRNVEWLDDPKWKNLSWQNKKYENIQTKLKNEGALINTFAQIISDKNIDKKDAKQLLQIISYRMTNALGIANSVDVKLDDKKLNATLTNIVRDTYDLGKDIFTNPKINMQEALTKLNKMSKFKTFGALSISSFIALATQYVNRQITKKRTGKDTFVGDTNYQNANANEKSKNKKNDKTKLWGLKLLASAGMIGMSALVMRIKSPKDFLNKLEFTGVVTSGNAMKTIYASQLTGRFLASRDENELRESATRDYLGFLNWLVFGGFVSKGVANLMDKGQNTLFNIQKNGTGLRHWLNETTLKSQAEIAAKGKQFAHQHIGKVNLAQAAGLFYSVTALGVLIPLLNIFITKQKQKAENKQ